MAARVLIVQARPARQRRRGKDLAYPRHKKTGKSLSPLAGVPAEAGYQRPDSSLDCPFSLDIFPTFA